jgi:Zn-dependent protease with chaperone function
MAAFVVAIIAAASLWRAWQLSEGGSAVAHFLGARYVNPDKCTPAERRLLNVVEEMSIASGIAVPPVYVLETEDAANALVAGYSANEAAIIVTRGALQKLSRDELQGVMGHEYSHILNGDMALNMRLAAVLAGLSWLGEQGEAMVLAAAEANRGVERDERGTGAFAVVFGAVLAFIGFPGVFAADAIKAAISRERELLADSASVQYTRNPDGIAGALDSILSLHLATNVLSAQAGGLSHMFFAPVVSRWWTFPTHPPIEERIRHAHPRFDRDGYRERRLGTRREVAVLDGLGNVVRNVPIDSRANTRATLPTAEHIDFAKRLLGALPEGLRGALRDPAGAECAMFALALGSEPKSRQQACEALKTRRGAECAGRATAMQVEVSALGRRSMLMLAELAVPAIKAQPQKARDAFIADLASVIESDRKITLSEFVLYTLLRQRLREGAGGPVRTAYRDIKGLQAEACLVLSLLAFAAGTDGEAAYRKGAAVLGFVDGAPLGPRALDTAKLREALEKLRQLDPFAKPAFLKACFEVAAADGVFRLSEAEIVRMIAATLDCPVPPLVEAQDPATLVA